MPSMVTRPGCGGIRVGPRDSPDLRTACPAAASLSPLRADLRVRPGSFRLPSRLRARHHGPMTDHQHAAGAGSGGGPDPGTGPGAGTRREGGTPAGPDPEPRGPRTATDASAPPTAAPQDAAAAEDAPPAPLRFRR